MRMGETAKITIQPKYGFRKVKSENFKDYIDHINFDDLKLIEKMKKTPLIYEITLINFVQIYDLTGDRNMMKSITNKGQGLLKPSEGDEIVFNFTLFIDDKIVLEQQNEKLILSSNNFSNQEKIIFKSLKKEEKAKIDVSKDYFRSMLGYNSGFINKYLSKTDFVLDLDKIKRISVEVEMLKFKNIMKTVEYKNIEYHIKSLNKGIGYVAPWKNSLVMLFVKIEINGEVVYSDIDDIEDLIIKIKKIKSQIKKIKNFEKNLQFIVEDLLKKESLPYSEKLIYDPLLNNFPFFILTEVVPKMRLLETSEITFKSYMDYLKVKDLEIFQDKKIKNYKFTICLLNFHEIPSIFNKNAQSSELIMHKLIEYKSLANYFFSKNLLSKSKKINKFLVDEFIKFVNLEGRIGKLTHNKASFETDSTGLDITTIKQDKFDEMNKEMRKVTSNLILIYFKLKKYKKCNDYINHFFVIFDQSQTDEKIIYFKYKTLVEGFQQFQEGKIFLEKLMICHPESSNIEGYKKELILLNEKILESDKKKNSLVKKMFKFDS